MKVGMREEDGTFEEGTVSYLADRRLRELAEMTRVRLFRERPYT